MKHKIDDQLMEKFSFYLEEGIGLHYPKERWPDLEKKMHSISKSLGYVDANTCISNILNKPLNADLIAILSYHLTIGETYFFRDTKRMEILDKQILPEIIKKHSRDKKIRIWSAACCTGEEPYTIAMMLDRQILDKEAWNISIIGSDINPEFLRKAELGSYKKWSFRTLPDHFKMQYFIPRKDGTYALDPNIKKMVHFTYLNLIEDCYTKLFDKMDLILCHNVLIYFSPRQIEKTIHQLSESLVDEGWLSISAIETPFVQDPHLSIRSYDGAVFFKKTNIKIQISPISPPQKTNVSKDEILLKTVLPSFIKKQPSPISHIIETASKADFHDLYQKKQYQEIISILSPKKNNSEFLKKNLSDVLLLIRTYANVGERKEAAFICEEALKIHKLDPKLHYLNAIIRTDRGEIQEAIQSLKSALFLDPNFIVAHYMLGTLEQKQKNNKASKRSFYTALELLQNCKEDEKLPGDEEISVSRMKNIIENSLKGSS